MSNRADTQISSSPVNVAVVGARGYSGLELCRLLLRHPRARLAAVSATSAFDLSGHLPETKARNVATKTPDEILTDVSEGRVQTVFMATPADVSLNWAPRFVGAGASVVDLSGAFRLKAGTPAERNENYLKWYRLEHTAAASLEEAEFGLVPWAGRDRSRARLIANPGCYATAVLMALIPLLRERLIDPESLVIDAKSGTTGAGRKAEERLLQAEVEGNCLPYKAGQHQHQPEIQQALSAFAGASVDFHFTPHLLDTRRGIIAGLYAKLGQGFDADLSAARVQERVQQAYDKAYEGYPLVEAAPMDTARGQTLLGLRRAVGRPGVQISFRAEGSRLYVFSLIDNLLKGAASQAVENFNRLLGEDVSLGLTDVEGVL